MNHRGALVPTAGMGLAAAWELSVQKRWKRVVGGAPCRRVDLIRVGVQRQGRSEGANPWDEASAIDGRDLFGRKVRRQHDFKQFDKLLHPLREAGLPAQ